MADAVPAGGLLVVGSSQPVRDLDLMMTPYPAGQRRLLLGNRGLAGIDGTVSTAIGAALGRDSSRAIAYLGDVTFVHDLNGLVIGPDEPRPDLTIVVANDDGGAIFATLEQGDERYAEAFERVFGTPHGVSIEAWCAATADVLLARADSVRRAAAADSSASSRGIHVVEVPLDRGGRRDLDRQVRALDLSPATRRRKNDQAPVAGAGQMKAWPVSATRSSASSTPCRAPRRPRVER